VEKKLDELTSVPRDPNTPESIEIKKEFWRKMSENFDKLGRRLREWEEEDSRNAPN
jgi:hypothetical protein